MSAAQIERRSELEGGVSTTPALIVENRSRKEAISAAPQTKKPGLRTAINEKCKECIYDPDRGIGTWRQQVTACTSRSCPLYPVRPVYRGGTK